MSTLNNELAPKNKMIPAKLVKRDSCMGINERFHQTLEGRR
jgi:hypothetical protein